MNIVNILEEIEKVDGDIYERISPRRKAMKEFFGLGSKVAAAAMPFALGSMFNKAYGQATPQAVIDVLQYALTLEHFEYNFYLQGNAATTLAIPAGDQRNAIIMIRDSEKKHVDYLSTVIRTINNTTPVSQKTVYDFTAMGTFPTVFTDYAIFLAVAQVLEDTGVRAYKGQAAALMGNQVVLTAALGIHAVEARHAAKIRYMRRLNGVAAIKPWITSTATVSNDTGIAAVNNNYAGATPENTVVQATVNIAGFKLEGVAGSPNISFSAAAEAFDEPLTKAEVLALVAPFGVS